MKKVFFTEEDWAQIVMYLRSKNIAWENNTHFQFDGRTAAIIFIATSILAIIIASLI